MVMNRKTTSKGSEATGYVKVWDDPYWHKNLKFPSNVREDHQLEFQQMKKGNYDILFRPGEEPLDVSRIPRELVLTLSWDQFAAFCKLKDGKKGYHFSHWTLNSSYTDILSKAFGKQNIVRDFDFLAWLHKRIIIACSNSYLNA